MTTKATLFAIGVTGIYFLYFSLLSPSSKISAYSSPPGYINIASYIFLLGFLWSAIGGAFICYQILMHQESLASHILGYLFFFSAFSLVVFDGVFYARFISSPLKEHADIFRALQMSFGTICISFAILEPLYSYRKKKIYVTTYSQIKKITPTKRQISKRKDLSGTSKSKPKSDGTKIYSLSSMKKRDFSFKIPSSGIRCANCGFMNRSKSKRCRNCGSLL